MNNDGGEISYKSTIHACHIGNITMAVCVNLLPVLFIPLREEFNLSFSQLGLLVSINFITQVAFDVIFSFFIDKYGFRRFLVASPVLAVTGFTLFSAAPMLTENPFPLFVLATVLFSGSCGLLELLLSPIVNAIPTDEKAAAMSSLHSFYCWGQILVVTVTTFAILLFGKSSWNIIMLCWMVFPITAFFLFLKVPLAPPVPEEKRQSFKMLDKKHFFILFMIIILFGGASELGMSQWASAFAEKALGINKAFGDVLGMGLFALAMGVCRMLHGKFGTRFDINKILTIGFGISVVCYLVAALSQNSVVALAACALTGVGVSMLWPGTLSAAAERYPLAGAWLFAVLAAGGDFGGALGPWMVGKIADTVQLSPKFIEMALNLEITGEQLGLKIGLLFGALMPLTGFALVVYMLIKSRKKVDKTVGK